MSGASPRCCCGRSCRSIASGGVGSTQDLYRLAHVQAHGRRLAGAIVGKALVEGRFSVEEGVAACAVSG